MIKFREDGQPVQSKENFSEIKKLEILQEGNESDKQGAAYTDFNVPLKSGRSGVIRLIYPTWMTPMRAERLQ